MVWLPFTIVVLAGSVEPSLTHSPATIRHYQDPGNPVRLEDIVVHGLRRGAARVPPEFELDSADIDALRAWDIGEALQRLTEIYGAGEAPLVIINGKRMPNSEVFSGFPPEALVRVEVLPPEATAIYGAEPGQRVVNLVLQRRFSTYDGRIAGAAPTQGGTYAASADLRQSSIMDENTHQLGARVSHEAALRAEDRQRDVDEAQGAGTVTLRPSVDTLSAEANLTRSLGDWSGVFSLNGQASERRSTSLFGQTMVEGRQNMESLRGTAGLTGSLAGWSVQANLNGQMLRSREEGIVDTRAENQSLNFMGSANRTLINLPTGPLIANLGASLSENRSIVNRDQGRTTATFNARDVRGALTIPLSQPNGGGLIGPMGSLLLTVGTSRRASSAGGGSEWNGALTWNPVRNIRLNGTWVTSTDSVPDALRFEPLYYGAPRVVFDFRTGQGVEIVPILGGSPDLRPPRSERMSIAASVGPFTRWGLSGNLGYQRMALTDGVSPLPGITEDVETTFPDRFQRDADGRLVTVDFRPINLDSSLTENLNLGLNFNLPRPVGPAANEATILRVSLNYNLRLRSTIALLEGQSELDRLRGDGGGISGQDIKILLDARRGRWGVNASARWQDGFRTRRNRGRDSAGDLVTEPLTAVDLKVSFQMTSSAERAGGGETESGRGASALQLALEVDNLFDERPSTHLGDGSPTPGFGRDIQDPFGRTIRLVMHRRF